MSGLFERIAAKTSDVIEKWINVTNKGTSIDSTSKRILFAPIRRELDKYHITIVSPIHTYLVPDRVMPRFGGKKRKI
jgi:hypothetical protein